MARCMLAAALMLGLLALAAGQQGTNEPTPPTTTGPIPASCPSTAEYRAPGGCKKCISKSSPFTKVYGGYTCVNPTTITSKSAVCTPLVLPAFIRSNLDKSRTVACINPQKRLVNVFLVTKNSGVPFLSSSAYIKKSIRLASSIPAVKLENGDVKVVPVGDRILLQFDDQFGVLKKRYGLTVRLTGALKRGSDPRLLQQCWTAYLKVCG